MFYLTCQELEKYFVGVMKESVVVGELLSVRAVLDAIKTEDRSRIRYIKETAGNPIN